MANTKKKAEYLSGSKTRRISHLLYSHNSLTSHWDDLPVAFATFDENGQILNANAAFLKLLKLNKDHIRPDSILEWFDAASKNSLGKALIKSDQHANQTQHLSLKLKPPCGRTAHAVVKACDFSGPTPPIFSMILVPHEALLPAKVLGKLSNRFKQLADERICHVLISRDRKVLECQECAQSILGIAVEKLKGTDFDKLFVEPLEGLRIWPILKSARAFEEAVLIARKDGKAVPIHLIAKELPFRTGTERYYLTFLDLSQVDGFRQDVRTATRSLLRLSTPF